MEVETIAHLKSIQKDMNILPIAAPHTEEFILEAATKKHLFWIRNQLFCKISQNASKWLLLIYCSQVDSLKQLMIVIIN